MLRIVGSLALVASCVAYQPGKAPAFSRTWLQDRAAPVAAALLTAVVTTQLPALATTDVAASTTAAQISLNRIPPTSISIQVRDLPVIGKVVSGVYSKLPDTAPAVKSPSITIQSPTDKAKAIQNIVQTGHLEFDVAGVVNTHMDIDVAAAKAGIMNVRIASDLIPKLPFQNAASFAGGGSPTGGKESPWNMVQNMGTGETYYYNEKTGVTQYAKPVL